MSSYCGHKANLSLISPPKQIVRLIRSAKNCVHSTLYLEYEYIEISRLVQMSYTVIYVNISRNQLLLEISLVNP